MRDLAGCWDRRAAWVEARRRCELLLSTPRLPRSRPHAPALGGSRTDSASIQVGSATVRFMSVSAGPLARIEAEARPGSRIALVGANGSGKSTLLAIAAGLHHSRRGQATIGGRPLADLGPAERRRMVHLVTPESPVLAGSLRRALTMGAHRRHDDAALVAKAEAFGLAPVLSRLGGLDGRVSEQARNLSTGEAQRIRLARAALSGARVLLLDEPEAGLDDGTALVLRLLEGSEATCIVATHDRDLASCMDEIWTLKAGSVETGPIEAARGSRQAFAGALRQSGRWPLRDPNRDHFVSGSRALQATAAPAKRSGVVRNGSRHQLCWQTERRAPDTPPKSRADIQALAAVPGMQEVVLPRGKLPVHEEFAEETAAAIAGFLAGTDEGEGSGAACAPPETPVARNPTRVRKRKLIGWRSCLTPF